MSNTVEKILFKGKTKDTFLAEVREEVEKYFDDAKKATTANWIVHLKSCVLVAGSLLLYFTLLEGWIQTVPRALLWILFGLSQSCIALNIGHDALHGSYVKSPLMNQLLGYLAFDGIGLSSYVWKQTHNRQHHVFTNIAGADPDINKQALLRLTPHDPWFRFHQYQHLYCWLLYALLGFNWIFYADYSHVWRHRTEIPKKEWLLFLTFKCLNCIWIIAIPLLYSPLPYKSVLIGLFLMQLAGGLTAAVIFQLAHVVEHVEFPLPGQVALIPTTWSAHELATTSNFATHSMIVTYMVGGLNFQIEHHLIPKISHCHYPAISKIVRAKAKKHRFPYHEQPSLIAAIASHFRFLRKMGRGFLNPNLEGVLKPLPK